MDGIGRDLFESAIAAFWLEETRKNLSGKPVSGPTIFSGISRIQSRNANHSTPMCGLTFVTMVKSVIILLLIQ